MSTVKDKILSLKENERFVSFEFFPPKTDTGFCNLLARLNRMLALNPLFITVTWGAGGSTSEKSLDLATTCQKDVGVTTILHLTCTNTNKSVIDQALKKAKENGIKNVLALRGDPPRTEEYWTPDCDFSNAEDLVKYIRETHGDYFCIGVAGYPEGHVDGADTRNQSPEKDIPYLIRKVQAGADFIITQLFYDASKFLKYEALLRSHDELKDIILIPGLMPVTTYSVFKRATKLSHALVPDDIAQKLQESSVDDDLVKELGVDIVTKIIKEINAKTNNRIKGYHFYCLNLEKSVASIMNRSDVLRPIMEAPSNLNENENAIESDTEEPDELAKGKGRHEKRRRKSSLLNENAVADKSLVQKTLIGKSLLGDKKTLVDISSGKGSLGKDANWDEYPNGRFGDSNSPAYGEIDGYGPSLKVSSASEAIAKWGSPEKESDLTNVFIKYLSGEIDSLPWVDAALSPETALIQEELFEINKKGYFSLASQPAVDGVPSCDKIFGWGPRNGFVYQKAFIEIFVPKKKWDDVILVNLKKYFDNMSITYYCGDNKGNVTSNLPLSKDSHNIKNTITWGVFPQKEVLLPTIIDFESFKAWNEEAFILWLEWARCYKRDSKPYQMLNSVYENYYLVSLISHDFKDEHALWNALLQNN